MTKTIRFKEKIIYREKYSKNRIINMYEIFLPDHMYFGQNFALSIDTIDQKKCKRPKFLIIHSFVRMIVIFCFYDNHDTYTYTWIHEISRFNSFLNNDSMYRVYNVYYVRSNTFDKLQFC